MELVDFEELEIGLPTSKISHFGSSSSKMSPFWDPQNGHLIQDRYPSSWMVGISGPDHEIALKKGSQKGSHFECSVFFFTRVKKKTGNQHKPIISRDLEISEISRSLDISRSGEDGEDGGDGHHISSI